MKVIILTLLIGAFAISLIGCASASSSGGSSAPTVSGYVDTSVGGRLK